MGLAFVLYFGEMFDKVNIISCAILILTITFLVIASIVSLANQESRDRFTGQPNEYRETFNKFFKILKYPLIASLLFTCLIPSSKTVYMMVAAKVGQDIATSPKAKELGGKLYQLINQKLDEQLSKKKN